MVPASGRRCFNATWKAGTTNEAARRHRPPTLDELCGHCGIRAVDRHTAPGDAYTTAELFLVLCVRLQRQFDRPLTAGDLPLG